MIVDVLYKCKLESTVEYAIIPITQFKVYITYKASINGKSFKDCAVRTFDKNGIDGFVKDEEYMKAYFISVIKTEIKKYHRQKIKQRRIKQAFKPFKKWTSCKIDVDID